MKTLILDFGNVIGFFDQRKGSRQLAGLAIPSAKRLVLASNTNDLHFEWIRKRFAEQLAHFDRLVLSYRIGVRKPERAFFAECLATAGALPGDCVFVDDRQDFVDAARGMGMAAVLYRAGSHVEHALRATGLGIP